MAHPVHLQAHMQLATINSYDLMQCDCCYCCCCCFERCLVVKGVSCCHTCNYLINQSR